MNADPNPAKAIFLEAIEEHAPDRWPEFLDRACAGRPDLRLRVDALLQAHREAGASRPRGDAATDPDVTTDDLSLHERPGTAVGPYKLLERIGEGGFGVVFLAEQQQPVRRKVALKVLKAGMDTRQVVARFEAERQALAILDHPNIAKVFDGGATPSGRPYFVMELVKGVPITDFCDQDRLTPRQRLGLFVAVCGAVQHAHQKGLIHRDLKPANVLVSRHDTTPVVKVIDFGVAKALGQTLTDKTLFTGVAQMVGTPLYMSPEQAGMSDLDVDTRSDIYSLGVLLYELLTGTTPFDKERFRRAGYDEIRRIIREEEPARPSTRLSTLGQAAATVSANRESDPRALSRLLRGELDWVVMKALEKDRNRRYDTANGFAMDLQRYLADEAVLACPPSAGYRLGKFVRRNRAVLAVTAVLSAALVLAVVVLAVSNVWVRQALQNESAALALAKTQGGLAREQQGIAEAEAKRAREQETTARRHLYAAHANLAAHAWEVGDAGRGLQLLEGMRLAPEGEDLRSFEWYALWRLCHPGHRLTLRGHAGPVQAVAYSPDGTTLATASDDETVRLWDAATGRIRGVFRGHGAGVSGAAFAPDGKTLATASQDGTVKLWDLPTGRERDTLTGHAVPVYAVAFSPDGTLLAAGGGSFGQPGELKLWDVATRLERATLKGHWSTVWSVAFSPDGTALASASADGTARLWDVPTGRERFVLDHIGGEGARGVAFTPDGKALASGGWGDLVVKLWDVDTGREQLRFRGHTGPVECVAVSPDGKTFASGGDDGTVWLWDPATGQRRALGHARPVRAVAFAPDGKTLATAGHDTTVQLWDLGSGQEPATLTGCTSWALAPDGKTLALSRGETVRLRDVATGQERAAFPAAAPVRMTFAPDGGTLIARGRDGTVRLWDVAAGRERAAVPGHPEGGGNVAVAFSPDGKRLAYRAWGQAVILYDVATGKEWLTIKGPQDGVCLAFAADGKALATGAYNRVELWDSSTGHKLATLAGPGALVNAVAFAPDGKTVAAGCRDGTIHLWDLATTHERARFRGHAGVRCLAFCPDGKSLASGGEDRTVKLWDLATGEERLTLHGHASCVRAVVFSSDGKTLAAGDADGTVILWRAAAEPEVAAQSATDVREERARRHADRGRQLRADNRPRDAAEAFRHARDLYAELAAEAPRFYRDLGVVQQELGQPEEAARAFRQLAALSKNAGAHNNEAWSLATAPDPRMQLPAVAVELAERAVELAPRTAFYWNTLGAARYRAGNWDGAIAALEKSAELRQGGDSFDWFFLAMAHWRRGDQEQGRKWYAPAALWTEKHAPENAELRRFRAEAAALLGLPETWLPVHDPAAGDETVWALVLEAAPGAAWAYTRRGEALALLQRWDEAAADFAKAGALSPDEPVLHYRLALARLGAGDPAGYRSTCAALLDRFGQTEQPEVARWVAWAAVLAPDAVSDRERPVQLAEAALRGDPKSRAYATTLGAALYRAGRFGEAIRRLDEAAAGEQGATEPGTVPPAYARFFLAMAHARAGHPGEARRWLEEGIRGAEAELRDPGDAASRTWNRRLTWRLLRQEAEDLLKRGSEASERVQRFARRSEWKQASEAAARWKELDTDEDLHLAWFEDSVLRLQLGDVPGYRQVCQDMLTRFGQAKDPVIVERTARTCLLRPAALDDLQPVFALAEQLVSGTEDHWAHRWFLLTRGAAEYRAGNYASAIDWLEKSMDANEPVPQRDAFAALFLAMAHHHQGQTGEARGRLNQAGRWLDERTRSLEPGDLGEEWSDWSRIEIVRREAEALLFRRASGSTK